MTPGPLWNGEQQQSFVSRLKGSSKAVFAVGYHLHRKGRSIEIPPILVSPTAADNMAHTDGGDLFVLSNGKRYRHEIKHRKRAFTSMEDWPDRHIFVSNVGMVERAAGSVHIYVLVNMGFTHAAFIKGATKDQWYVLERKPSNTDVPEKVYCCPKELVGFTELERWS